SSLPFRPHRYRPESIARAQNKRRLPRLASAVVLCGEEAAGRGDPRACSPAGKPPRASGRVMPRQPKSFAARRPGRKPACLQEHPFVPKTHQSCSKVTDYRARTNEIQCPAAETAGTRAGGEQRRTGPPMLEQGRTLIVGGGIAGLTLAAALHAQDF